MKIEITKDELGTIIERLDHKGEHQELMNKLCDIFNAQEIKDLKHE